MFKFLSPQRHGSLLGPCHDHARFCYCSIMRCIASLVLSSVDVLSKEKPSVTYVAVCLSRGLGVIESQPRSPPSHTMAHHYPLAPDKTEHREEVED